MDSLIKLKRFSAMKQILNTVDIYSVIKPLLYLSEDIRTGSIHVHQEQVRVQDFAYRLPVPSTHL